MINIDLEGSYSPPVSLFYVSARGCSNYVAASDTFKRNLALTEHDSMVKTRFLLSKVKRHDHFI